MRKWPSHEAIDGNRCTLLNCKSTKGKSITFCVLPSAFYHLRFGLLIGRTLPTLAKRPLSDLLYDLVLLF